MKCMLLFISFLSLLITPAVAQDNRSPEAEFDIATKLNWKQVFTDDCKTKWKNKWFLDGEQARIINGPDGMDFYAGKCIDNDASHAVLWTKQTFSGDIRIEYDFTRLDTLSVPNNVNIIYLLAEGSGMGEYTKDIYCWRSLRKAPSMDIYFNHMSAYHISYAVNGAGGTEKNYLRARRYIPETGKGLQGTALTPEYSNILFFEPGVKHHITIIKCRNMIYMMVKNNERETLFHFSTANHKDLKSGRIGLRHMWKRDSRYANFTVYQL
ncbi:hypothetical protein [Bacteroides sedimenti]|uniref:DUF1961 family protein n=1 Tax=Bacteroides sedimenti TaxID=2136147 RepID=A0ABM8IJT5_9BACE